MMLQYHIGTVVPSLLRGKIQAQNGGLYQDKYLIIVLKKLNVRECTSLYNRWVKRGEIDRHAAGVKDDCWVGRGEAGHQQVWRMTSGRGGVNLTTRRGERITAGWEGVKIDR